MKKFIILVGILSIAFAAGCRNKEAVKSEATHGALSSPTSTVKVDQIIPFGKRTRVSTAVKNECNLGGNLSNYVQSAAYTENIKASTSSGKRKLVMNISRVRGGGGGAWSGAKSVSVEGKLMEGSKVIGSFSGTRTSGGGAFGGYKGTCSILGRCTKTLGKDIAQFLANPSMDAYIGE